MSFIQWKNPRNKQWTKFDADQGKIVGTSPERFEGIPLAKPQTEMELDVQDKSENPEDLEPDKSKDDYDNSPTFF